MSLDSAHSLLRRQLKRCFGTDAEIAGELQHFIGAVDEAYRAFDADRRMLERSLELSSQELMHASAEMRAVFQAIPDLLIRLDQQGTVLDCKIGAMSDDASASPLAFAASHLTDEFRAAAKRVGASRRRETFEYTLERAGEKLRYEARLVPVLQEQVVAFVRDMTARRRAEALRVGQNRILEMIVDGAPLDRTLHALADLFEAQVDGMMCSIRLLDPSGQALESFAAPSMDPQFIAAARCVFVGEGMGGCGTAAHRRQLVVSADIRADPLWADLRSLTDSYGLRACWSAPIISNQDTLLGTFAMYFRQPRSPSSEHREMIELGTRMAGIAIQRRQSEQELQRTVSLVRSTFDSTADGILVVDAHGRITTFNKRFVSIWQLPPAVIESRDDKAALDHVLAQLKDPEAFLRRVRELQAEPEATSFDTVDCKDGRVFERYSCAQYLDGLPIGRVWSFRDVSERTRLEEQFRQAQKMEAIGQLAGGVAHDFNNLLTVILGNLSVMRAYDLTPDQQRAAIEDCFRSAQRAANLTGQLLTFSRRQPIEPRELDLNEVVANLTKMLQRLIGEHIALETRYALGGAQVRADVGMMEQALMNLALNSRDAMPRGGRLQIATSAVYLDADSIRARSRGRPGKFVQLSVTDTGLGIAPEHLPHIFEPFFTTKEVGKGTGLGLATVFGIVEQHEGWIEVESQPGVGTTMRIFLPQLTKTQPVRVEPSAVSLPRLGTETILVAEDEAEVRALMSKVLQRHGYRVHAAANAAEATMIWRERKGEIDLLITDMVMPGGVGGRELADRFLAEKPDLRVVYCSGYTDEMLGPDLPLRRSPHFLEKPFDVHRFLQRVRVCLDEK